MFRFHGLGTTLPIYVTRKTADGQTAHYSLSLWMTVLVILLVWLSIIIWSIVGFITAFRVVF